MKYWIRDLENQYWCKTKMKPSGSKDIPSNYRTQGYWSRFKEDYDIRRRIKYFWVTGKITQFFMRYLSQIKTSLEPIEE